MTFLAYTHQVCNICVQLQHVRCGRTLAGFHLTYRMLVGADVVHLLSITLSVADWSHLVQVEITEQLHTSM